MASLETHHHRRVARKALAGALVGALVGYGCAPIAPSLEKSRFVPAGNTVPGGIPLNGNIYQTQLSPTEPTAPSQNRIALETTAVNQFRANGQVQLLLGSLPPGGIRGLFVIALPSSAVSSLQEFRTEMFETSLGSGMWVLRVRADVNASISQLVRDHLQKIYLEFGVNDQASFETDTETGTENDVPQNPDTETEDQTDPDVGGVPEEP